MLFAHESKRRIRAMLTTLLLLLALLFALPAMAEDNINFTLSV